jgi:protein tyrosine kinase modulator
LELDANRAQTAISLIEEQLAERRRQLNELDQRIQATEGRSVGELPDERAQNLGELRQVQFRLDSVTANRDRANQQRAVLQSTLVGSLNARLNRLQDERATLLKSFTTKHPEVMRKDQQIAEVEAEMEGIKAGAKAPQSLQGLLASADPSIVQLEGQLEANALEIDSLSKEAAKQTAIIADYQRRLNANPVHEQQSSALAAEARELNDEIADLSRKQQQSGLAVNMERRQEQQQFRLVDPASLPTHPSSRKRQQASLAAVAAGPLLGIVLALLLDLRRPTFQNEDQLRRTFAAPLILSVPVLPTPRERRAQTWRSTFELLAGCVVAVVIALTEFYAYRMLS